MKLSPAQLALVAAGAGWSGSDLITAVAVALAESGGDPQAFNPEGSVGLWQIYRPAHPEFANDNLMDPATNASDAFQIYRDAGASFIPWSAYKNGRAAHYLVTAQNAVQQLSAAAQAVVIAPGVAVLPPAPDDTSGTSSAALASAGAQITQLPPWLWIVGGAVAVWAWLQE